MASRYTFKWKCHTKRGVVTGTHTIVAENEVAAWDIIKQTQTFEIEGLPEKFTRFEWLEIRMVESIERERDDG